jgi:hypothetical protein
VSKQCIITCGQRCYTAGAARDAIQLAGDLPSYPVARIPTPEPRSRRAPVFTYVRKDVEAQRPQRVRCRMQLHSRNRLRSAPSPTHRDTFTRHYVFWDGRLRVAGIAVCHLAVTSPQRTHARARARARARGDDVEKPRAGTVTNATLSLRLRSAVPRPRKSRFYMRNAGLIERQTENCRRELDVMLRSVRYKNFARSGKTLMHPCNRIVPGKNVAQAFHELVSDAKAGNETPFTDCFS